MSTPEQLRDLAHELAGHRELTLRVIGDEDNLRGRPVDRLDSHAGRRARRYGSDGGLPARTVWEMLGPVIEGAAITTHGVKEALQRLAAAGIVPGSIAMDTEIAAYLVDPPGAATS